MDREVYEDTEQLAKRTGTSMDYWTKRRVSGEGPPYCKLDAWCGTGPKTSMSGSEFNAAP